MNSTLFLPIKPKFTILPPIIWSFKIKHRSFWVSSVKSKIFGILNINTINPYLHILSHINGRKVLNLLIQNKWRIEKQLPCLINHPNSHSSVSTTCYKLVYFIDIYHIKNTSFMPWDRLEAWVSFYIAWFPKFNCAICRSSYQDILFLHTRKNYFTNWTFMSMRRVNLCTVRLLSLLKYWAIIHCFAFILKQLSIWET